MYIAKHWGSLITALLSLQLATCDFDTIIQFPNGKSSEVITNLIGKAKAECPDKFVKYRNKCYYFGVLRVDWNDAKKHCNAMGAERVALETYDEDMFVSEYAVKLESLSRLFYPINKAPNTYHGHLLAFWTDGVNGGPGSTNWKWATSGKAIDYTRWHSDQPNDWRGSQVGLSLYRWLGNNHDHSSAFDWHDFAITLKQNGIICEMKTFTS